MRNKSVALLAFLLASAALVAPAQQLFNVPVRINMGGHEVVDSFGRTWLGDGPGPGDPLNIRPDDAGGAESAENWGIQNFQPDSLDALGFDSTNPDEVYMFNTIRWDIGASPPDFRMEIPTAEGDYTVNLYFNENFGTGRHFKIEIQGDIVDDDVSYLDYDTANPALGRVGVLSFPGIAVGPDNLLKIGLLPCSPPDCPDSTDNNAIIEALEVLSAPECDHLGLDFNCVYRPDTDDVRGTWNSVVGADSIRVFKNGAQFGADLPGTATSFTDSAPRSGGDAATYVIQALDGGIKFKECRSYVNAKACPANLACSVDQATGKVSLSWTIGGGVGISGFEVRRDGALLQSLPGTASTFDDTPTRRSAAYSVTPLTAPVGQCSVLNCSVTIETKPFDVPLRINMGGAETVDSKGRTWLGDGPGPGDPLGIRVDDASGTNTIESWCPVAPTSLRKIGLDPTNANDNYIMSTIRWDTGNDGIDFRMELRVPDDPNYLVNLYFNECCCPGRHFKIEIQDEIVEPDVSYLDYDKVPVAGKVGVLTFRSVAVTDGILRIALLPCPDPECAGSGDTNAILNAIEVLTNPCLDPAFRACPEKLTCTFFGLGRKVIGNWGPGLCIPPVKYELYKNGDFLRDLPGDSLSFNDTLAATERVAEYGVQPILPDGIVACPILTCVAQNPAIPFSIPLRLNMGGRFLTDSRGNKWIGDGAGPGDSLDLRPDDTGGTNTIENWCTAASIANADSMRSLGLDPANPNDQGIYNTIRWDLGPLDPNGDTIDFRLELPIPNGDYLLNFYLTECCCMNRHFMLEAEGEILDDDVSSADYSAVPNLGRTGRLTFDHIAVTDGALSLGILPCPLCPFDPFPILDTNAIIDAIEVLPAGTTVKTCPRDLLCSIDGATVTGDWTGPENVTVTGYEVFRDGAKIATLPASATSFVDNAAPCQRITTYEVAPLSDAADFLCPGMRMLCRLIQPDCPFSTPLRINMGGGEAIDSHGNLWLGDGPGAGDPLNIRTDDASGANWIENWCAPADDSLTALGFDPTNAADRYILSTIRWDTGGDGIDFLLEIPIENGEYSVNFYFNECCCPGRHFKIELEGDLVDDDVSYLDYDTANPDLGRVGRLTFEHIKVEDDILNIGILPCPECPGAIDTNAIVDAIEILSGTVVNRPKFHRGDADQNGQLQLTDAVQILGFLFLGIATKVPECPDAADTDDNGQIQLTDAVRILSYLFLGVGTVSPPGPPPEACGTDPTDDDTLGDCNFNCK